MHLLILATMMPDRNFHVVLMQVIGRSLDGIVPFWGSFMMSPDSAYSIWIVGSKCREDMEKAVEMAAYSNIFWWRLFHSVERDLSHRKNGARHHWN